VGTIYAKCGRHSMADSAGPRFVFVVVPCSFSHQAVAACGVRASGRRVGGPRQGGSSSAGGGQEGGLVDEVSVRIGSAVPVSVVPAGNLRRACDLGSGQPAMTPAGATVAPGRHSF
jgi:hypothetical protein